VSRVAIVTDSASDLTPEQARAAGIRIVPLEVTFGSQRFKAGVDLTTEAFWERMVAPDAPFPTTAAASPGDFRAIFSEMFEAGADADADADADTGADTGADAIVCVNVAGTLSGTIQSATIAREMLADREIHIVDSTSASMGEGMLALLGAEMAAAGSSAAEISARMRDRTADLNVFVALDTLEYLRKGGRISGTQAAIGGFLSVKPIITIKDGAVDTADRVRTRSKARERVLELLTQRPVERLAILYTTSTPEEVQAFRDEVVGRVPGGVDAGRVTVNPVGPSVGPHLGPGCLGGVVLYAR
jgi:DegV family protein with EDD domain